MLQSATPLRKSAPWPPTSLMNMSLVLRLPRRMHLCRSSSNAPRLPSFLEMLQNPHVLLTFEKVHNPLRLPRESTSERPKVLCTRQFLHSWLRNVLRATTACTFSTSQLPKVVPTWCVLYILTWKCASRHNGVQFSSLIWPDGPAPAALASLLFDPLEPQIIGKTQCFATFLPFRASASSFFWLFLSSDLLSSTLLFSLTFPISAFHVSILSEIWLLNFLRPYSIVGQFDDRCVFYLFLIFDLYSYSHRSAWAVLWCCIVACLLLLTACSEEEFENGPSYYLCGQHDPMSSRMACITLTSIWNNENELSLLA